MGWAEPGAESLGEKAPLSEVAMQVSPSSGEVAAAQPGSLTPMQAAASFALCSPRLLPPSSQQHPPQQPTLLLQPLPVSFNTSPGCRAAESGACSGWNTPRLRAFVQELVQLAGSDWLSGPEGEGDIQGKRRETERSRRRNKGGGWFAVPFIASPWAERHRPIAPGIPPSASCLAE